MDAPIDHRQAVLNSVDDYAKSMCLQLLEYMAKNTVECEMWEAGARFHFKGEWLTADQLFENFL